MESLIVDESGWPHVRMTGSDRVRFLQGMCTANVETLPVGGAIRACMLSAKGRVVALFEIVKRDDDLLLLVDQGRADETASLLGRYAIMDEVELAPVELQVYREWGAPETVLTSPPVLAAPPRPPASADTVEIRRIEGGLPRMGVDIGEDYFPFETPLGQFVDYQKGCYIGQEPISRVYFQGKAQKALRGLRFADGRGPVAAGAKVVHADRASAGTVTSAAVSPDFGPIALAYLHRTVFEPGGEVTVDGRTATVVELPFR